MNMEVVNTNVSKFSNTTNVGLNYRIYKLLVFTWKGRLIKRLIYNQYSNDTV